MLKQTFLDKAVRIGDEVEVSETVGARLIRNKIAKPVFIEEVETEKPEEETKIDRAPTAKELFEECKLLSIKMDKAMLKGKSEEEKKEYLSGLLVEFQQELEEETKEGE